MENKINYAAMTLDEIIFIGRNKDYGAFDLRRSYNLNVKRAILGTIFFSALAMCYQTIFARIHALSIKKNIETVVDLTRIETIEIKKPPLPNRPDLPPPPKGVANAATVAMGEKRPVSDKTAPPDTFTPVEQDVAISDMTRTGTKGEASGVENGTGDITYNIGSAE